MSDDQQRSRHSLTVWLIVVALLFPVIYVLSAGPAVWLYNHGGFSPAVNELIALPYAPLGLLRDNCKPLGDLLDWYIDLWP